MEIADSVERNLCFLETEYGFAHIHVFERGDHYFYTNKYGRIEIYDWAQFKEREIRIITNQELRIIDMLLEKPKEMAVINNKKKGIKGFFYDDSNDYYDVVSSFIKEEIAKTGTIFGLRI